MRYGIFTKLISDTDINKIFRYILDMGFECTQFNLSVLGMPTVPNEHIGNKIINMVRDAIAISGIDIPIISGTCNLISPDPKIREMCVIGIVNLIQFCELVGIPCISICTGTRNPENMWVYHKDNETISAWDDLEESINKILSLTAGSEICLAIEPERANVVSNYTKALNLLHQMDNQRLQIIFDAANIIANEPSTRQRDILNKAHTMLKDNIVVYHMKELYKKGGLQGGPIGSGQLDIPFYLSLIKSNKSKPIIIHGLSNPTSNFIENSLTYLKDIEAEVESRG